LVVFLLIHIAPGDPASILLGMDASEAERDAITEQLGLNEPLVVQLGIWTKNVLKGDLGNSLLSKHSVAGLIVDRAMPTLSLAFFTQLFAVSLAIPLGIIAAWKANTWIDRVIMFIASLGFSMPVFWLGFILIFLFALKLPILPVAGYVPLSDSVGLYFKHLVLPVVATGLVVMALITRMTRATMLEVLREDYVRVARAKGLAEHVVLLRHAFRTAAIPIVTVIGLGTATLLSGVIITEVVFAYPGLGRLLLNAIQSRDYPIIQGTVLVISAVFVFVNLFIDVIYGFLDPRVRR